jgi:hypothetical protein
MIQHCDGCEAIHSLMRKEMSKNFFRLAKTRHTMKSIKPLSTLKQALCIRVDPIFKRDMVINRQE